MCYSEESIFNQIKYPCVLSVLSAIPSNCPIGLIIATGKFNNGQHYHAKNMWHEGSITTLQYSMRKKISCDAKISRKKIF